ncbi:PucR family transcriptional regulator [Actinokineospora terrae]|uniref:PucR C-terminal helix-turn-helix domain-containing protein n=1 Tax=Actinokineospora terrae TaxID=155974 RepID=A0A1H9XNF5_9PSEU|nr:PucR family transcriptional regulator [Actinokineospora terrae]SES47549.1 PucR C-terminal helix-turn-helix domain-containing protein [Actinokineospora terrae]
MAGTPDTGRPAELWAALPAEVARRIRPAELVAEVVAEIQAAVPEYAGPLRGRVGQVLLDSVAAVVRPDGDHATRAAALRYAARVEHAEGRTLDALQTAVRVGARVVWRRVSELGRGAGVPTAELFDLADLVFAHVDALCATAMAGYATAEGLDAVRGRRRALVRLLLAEHPPADIADTANAAQWPLPDEVTVVLAEGSEAVEVWAAATDALLDTEGTQACLVIAGQSLPPAEGLVVVGPTVRTADAHDSLSLARRAWGLARRGVLPDTGVLRCADHLAELLLLADEFLLARLADRELAPLAGLPPRQRERLTATLLAWLRTTGGTAEVAAALDIHPQTVRYRLHQLTDLLGDRLIDPAGRLALEMALRGRAVLPAR